MYFIFPHLQSSCKNSAFHLRNHLAFKASSFHENVSFSRNAPTCIDHRTFPIQLLNVNNTLHIVQQFGVLKEVLHDRTMAEQFQERKTALLQKGTLHVYRNALYFDVFCRDTASLKGSTTLLFYFVLHFCLLFLDTFWEGSLSLSLCAVHMYVIVCLSPSPVCIFFLALFPSEKVGLGRGHRQHKNICAGLCMHACICQTQMDKPG